VPTVPQGVREVTATTTTITISWEASEGMTKLNCRIGTPSESYNKSKLVCNLKNLNWAKFLIFLKLQPCFYLRSIHLTQISLKVWVKCMERR